MEFEKELMVAEKLARTAGAIMLSTPKISISRKKDNSVVTNVDKELSSFLTSSLKQEFPEYGVLSEENLEDDQRQMYQRCWIIDPLDGTNDYVSGGSNFGVMLGLLDNYQPVFGATYQPIRDEFAYAARGSGAFLVKEGTEIKLNVSSSETISALVSRFRRIDELEEMLERIKPSTIANMPTAFKTVEVAKGNATLFLSPREIIMNLWDLCAPTVILEEAGGRITDLYGRAFIYSGGFANYNGIIASNGLVHDYVINHIISLR